MTCSIMTLGIMTLGIMTLGIMTLGIICQIKTSSVDHFQYWVSLCQVSLCQMSWRRCWLSCSSCVWILLSFWGRFVEQKLLLCSSFRCDPIYYNHFYVFGLTLKSDLDVQQTRLRFLQLGVNSFNIWPRLLLGKALESCPVLDFIGNHSIQPKRSSLSNY